MAVHNLVPRAYDPFGQRLDRRPNLVPRSQSSVRECRTDRGRSGYEIVVGRHTMPKESGDEKLINYSLLNLRQASKVWLHF